MKEFIVKKRWITAGVFFGFLLVTVIWIFLPLFYNNRGVSYYDKGDFDKAISDYNKAIELNPDLATAYNNRGLIYSDKGQHDKAIVDYYKAFELNPIELLRKE